MLLVCSRDVDAQIDQPGDREWGEFSHKPNAVYQIEDIRREIQDETMRKLGKFGVSEDPILLRIYSPNVIDLTLVDLPGLTKASNRTPTRLTQDCHFGTIHRYAIPH